MGDIEDSSEDTLNAKHSDRRPGILLERLGSRDGRLLVDLAGGQGTLVYPHVFRIVSGGMLLPRNNVGQSSLNQTSCQPPRQTKVAGRILFNPDVRSC